MKPFLIDEFLENQNTSAEFTVDVDGRELQGWQIAKPLNYDPEYLSKKDRREMANAIMKGKAIAVCFFEDLSPEEQAEYVRKRLP